MSWPEFDSVKAEKADAIRRYNRSRNFVSSFHRLITAFALLSSFPYFSLLKEIISSYFSLFNRQLYVFGLINAMIFVIYRFSNIAGKVNCDRSAVSPPDLYDENIFLSSSSGRREKIAEEETKSADSTETEIRSPEEKKFSDKQIVVSGNAKSAPEKEETTIDVLRLRRTRSERFAPAEAKKSELRRSETENWREVAAAGCGEGKSMEDMNSDEFRFTIERFIASKKKLLRDENFAAVMEERGTTFVAANAS